MAAALFAVLAVLYPIPSPARHLDRADEITAEQLQITTPSRIVQEVIDLPPSKHGIPALSRRRIYSHPGYALAYVVSGEVLVTEGEGPELRFRKGQQYDESAGEWHTVINPSRDRSATLLMTYVVPAGSNEFGRH